MALAWYGARCWRLVWATAAPFSANVKNTSPTSWQIGTGQVSGLTTDGAGCSRISFHDHAVAISAGEGESLWNLTKCDDAFHCWLVERMQLV